MIKKIILWGGVTAFLCVLFYYLIPITLYQSFTSFIAFTGGISIAISAAIFTLGLVTAVNNGKTSNKRDIIGSILIIGVFLSCLVGGVITFLSRDVSLVNEELERNGVFVVAKVVGGDSFSTRSIDMTKIRVMFKLDNGNNTTEDVFMSKYEFKQFYLDQELPILYSSKNPSIVKVLTTDEEIYKYSHLRK
ncbi:hypothetical protein G7074_17935 [Pedobacter sp. HDW13]|uniref:hypothetical protein n=1 Tax=unclassified Pedobacter TaxID=2628915 RepID=UPI000F595A01|nr:MULTISPECIES: hypothetical protein [unclassified Pedobacter]QIL40979.1 hypothetical protein G7074_17935 [Pedobacter sp. HDW13]RQO65021.1 hypothetical protein DBR40_24415 [Pedobacter sp. KBW01]